MDEEWRGDHRRLPPPPNPDESKPVIGTAGGLLHCGVDVVACQPQETAVRPQADVAPLPLRYVTTRRIKVPYDEVVL